MSQFERDTRYAFDASVEQPDLAEVAYLSAGDLSLDTGAIESFVKLLADADRSSRAALQSKSSPVGQTALSSIDSSIQALDVLEATLKKLEGNVHRRRAHVSSLVHSIRNAALPIMRLPPEIFSLIITMLASCWEHAYSELGWIKTSHVCSAWRDAVISLASLWARAVGVFHPPDSFHTILSRAREVPLTLQNPWVYKDDSLPEYYWSLLSQPHKIHNLNLELTKDDMPRLADVFSRQSNFKLRSLKLSAWFDCMREVYPTMAPILSLRDISFQGVYIPFRAPNLISLSILNGETFDNRATNITCSQLLDVLESCQKLVKFELDGWMPADAPHTRLHKVRLPCLQELKAIASRYHAPFTALFGNLEVPELRKLVMHHDNRPVLPAIFSIFNTLVTSNPIPPCIKNTSYLSVQGLDGQIGLSVCFEEDPREAANIGPPLNVAGPHAAPLDKPLLLLEFPYRLITGEGAASAGVFHSVMSARATSRAPAIKSVHFENYSTDAGWRPALLPLEDVQTLYLPDLHTRPSIELLIALSTTDANGSLLLPGLHTVVCGSTRSVLPPRDPQEHDTAHTLIFNWVTKMLRTRSAYGSPLTCIKAGSPSSSWVAADGDGEADEYFAQLVSSCTVDY